ncbi:hypothetical protein IWW38_005583, partial [Coemansia aciculifera]
MAHGKGNATGTKKKSGRQGKGHGVDMHEVRDAENALYSSNKGKHISASAGSSGKQAQMVFTIGTFDDDDDSYISDQLRSTAAAATSANTHVSDKEVEGSSHVQARLLGARVDDSELPASWKGAGLAKPAATQRLQLKRQTLFTMGSHSEASDMDGGGDIYNMRLGRSAYAARHKACADNSSADSSDAADAVVANSSNHGDRVVPDS